VKRNEIPVEGSSYRVPASYYRESIEEEFTPRRIK